jgi:type I restriction enzyme S subunit
MNAWQTSALAEALVEAKPGFACGEDPPDGVFQFRMNNITTEGQLDLSKKRRVPKDTRNLRAFFLEPGDVLFNATNSPALVGKSAYFPGHSEPAVFSNHFLRLKPKDKALDGRFLARWLLLQFQRKVFEGMCRQWVNQATVGRDSLLALQIPLPPLPEQRRIAEVLDRAEALRAKRRAALAQLDTLTQSIFLNLFGDPRTNPRDFLVRRLSELIRENDRINYGVVQPGDDFDEGVPLVRVADLVDGRVDHRSLKQIAPAIESTYTRSRLRGDEILVVCVGYSIGVVAIVGQAEKGFNIARAVARIPLSHSTDRAFMAAYLQTDFVQHYFANELRTVAQPTLNIKQLAETPVMLPPFPLQQQFAGDVAAVDKLKSAHRASLAKLDALFASLQHRAFRGEL